MSEPEKADATDATEDAGKESKSGGKKLLIIGLIVGLLVGGGAGVGAFLMMGSPATKEAVDEPEPVVNEPEAELYFVKLEHVTLPIIHNDRVLGNLMVQFSLKVASNEDKMTVIRNLPEIRDAMLRHYSITSIGKDSSPKSIDYDRLKQTLKDISNKIMGHSTVTKALIVQVRQF